VCCIGADSVDSADSADSTISVTDADYRRPALTESFFSSFRRFATHQKVDGWFIMDGGLVALCVREYDKYILRRVSSKHSLRRLCTDFLETATRRRFVGSR